LRGRDRHPGRCRSHAPILLLAIAAAGFAFVPFAPQIRIEPELALALFVAPALLDAAFDTSPRDLRRNAIPIASLAVVAVVMTAAAVAFLGWRFAGLPIAAAIALGATDLLRGSPGGPAASNSALGGFDPDPRGVCQTWPRRSLST
jgi:monovalent cation/hydrogen antiporter